MGQVRGSDVGRREARAPVEDPGLGVQPGGAAVIGDLDLPADLDELLQRRSLGRSGVGRGQHPERAAGLAMATQGREQRTDAAPADEGHDHVDAVGGVDLGVELVPQPRLARGVGEQGGVEERDQRLGDGSWSPVDASTEDGVQNRSLTGGGRRGTVGRGQVAQALDQDPCDLEADAHPVDLGDLGEGLLDLATQVERDAVGRLRRAEGSCASEPLAERRQPRLQPLGDERLVQPRLQVPHVRTVRRRRRRSGPHRAGLVSCPSARWSMVPSRSTACAFARSCWHRCGAQ